MLIHCCIRYFVLSTELIMWIGHHKVFLKEFQHLSHWQRANSQTSAIETHYRGPVRGYRCHPSEFQTLSCCHFRRFWCRCCNFISVVLKVAFSFPWCCCFNTMLPVGIYLIRASLYWPINIINLGSKPKLSCRTPQSHSITVSSETLSLKCS